MYADIHIRLRTLRGRLRNCHINVSDQTVNYIESVGALRYCRRAERIRALDFNLLQNKLGGIARLKGVGGAVLSVAIGTGAIFALAHTLKHVDIHQVLAIIRETHFRVIALALLLVTGSYGSITLYDWLALHTMGRRDVPYRIAALASFTSYPIAHGLGAVALVSPIIRYRIYSGNGIGAIGVANICFLTGLTFWLGNMTALGFSLLYEPAAISIIDHLSPATNRLLALALLGGVGVFLVWSWLHPRSLGRNRWLVRLPSGPLVLLQIVVGLLDLMAAAVAMYVLLPAGLDIGLFRLVAVFIAATLLGFISHAPAGLGVFDATILIGLGGEDREQLLAALLMFRCLYHLVPLVAALALFGGVEAWRSLSDNALPSDPAGHSDRRVELEADHSGDDQRQANDPDRIGRLAVEQHSDQDTADGADPGPNRIRRAKRQRP
jgi:glycosyltransferase 2 family protein